VFRTIRSDEHRVTQLVIDLDQYAVSQGRRQTGHAEPPITEPYVGSYIYWWTAGAPGGESPNVRTAGNAAVELAEAAERVREKHL
jgi:hypothetical protein